MRNHTTMTNNALKLPAGGILEIYREGSIGSFRARAFTVRHQPAMDSHPNEHQFFHSKTTLPEVAVDYLGLTARLIRPSQIILPAELSELWKEKLSRDVMGAQLAKIRTEVAR